MRAFTRSPDLAMNPMLWRYAFGLIVLGVSWFVFQSKVGTLAKATYLTMPLMVLLVLEEIQFYQQPKWVPIGIGVVLLGGVMFYLYKKKLSWQYYFATIYPGLLALWVIIAEIEI